MQSILIWLGTQLSEKFGVRENESLSLTITLEWFSMRIKVSCGRVCDSAGEKWKKVLINSSSSLKIQEEINLASFKLPGRSLKWLRWHQRQLTCSQIVSVDWERWPILSIGQFQSFIAAHSERTQISLPSTFISRLTSYKLQSTGTERSSPTIFTTTEFITFQNFQNFLFKNRNCFQYSFLLMWLFNKLLKLLVRFEGSKDK